MKFTKPVPTTFDVAVLECSIGVRYWEDAEVNDQPERDEDENTPPKMPLVDGDRWKINIDLETGTIKGWPKGTTAKTHYKVCDDGVYTLKTADGEVVHKRAGYVPNILAPKGGGYGDYVILDIDEDGKIAAWNPDLRYFEKIED